MTKTSVRPQGAQSEAMAVFSSGRGGRALCTVNVANELGATMVSVLLLTVSLMTVAVLVVRASNREIAQANALVARERGLMAAQATIELGAAQLRHSINQGGSASVVINQALTGYNNA